MWIWRGVICPEPGEHIKDAAREAIAICKQFKGDKHTDEFGGYPAQGYFEFTFNGVKLLVWTDSQPEEIVWQYEHEFRGTTK